MHKLLFTILVLTAAAALSGCGNTLSGAKEDAANDAAKTQQAASQAAQSTKAAADQAGQAIATVPQNAEANTVVRPAVKTAIIRDPVLSQSGNLIDVNAGPRAITLTGHVLSADMKQRATEDAQVALKRHPGYTLINNLTVAGAGQ